jgi:transposase
MGHACRSFWTKLLPAIPDERLVMILDGAGWHHSYVLCLPENLRLLSLPAYLPELNPVEPLWDELREKSFHNRVFKSLEALEEHLEIALHDLELDPQRVRSFVDWHWIISVVLN